MNDLNNINLQSNIQFWILVVRGANIVEMLINNFDAGSYSCLMENIYRIKLLRGETLM